MSCPSPEPPASPLSGDSLKRLERSRYTYRQIQLLRQGSTASQLRVIAHVDLDAFYAQCEMVRLGTPRSTPLAVQQWDSLIAINYPARDFGITRMISAKEAKKLCPEIILQHVATFREGEGGKWAYRDDSFKNMGTDKVCLDPYRAESRKILKVMRDELSRWHANIVDDLQRLGEHVHVQEATLEKASVDEVFMDLSPLVFGILLQRYPELRLNPPDDDRITPLPCPPSTALEWHTEDCLVDLDENETEVDSPDWDDVSMLIGSEIVRAVRTAVWDNLSYTCSGGIAKNKMMAKLGSACNKPNKQTVIRNRAIQNFLSGFKFTKIRMLGGKLGDQVTTLFGTEQVSDLLKVPLEQFRTKLNDDTATWLYGIIRGEDRSEVNPRTQIKSMLSAKSFRPSINNTDQAEMWLRIFAADIYGRLVEDGVLEHKRRPKTIALHHRQSAQLRSRQIPIPSSAPIDEALLFDLAKTLFRQMTMEGSVWPCANLSLSVVGFEDGVSKNQAIDNFLIRGELAKDIKSRPSSHTRHEFGVIQEPSEKRRKLEDSDVGIRRFFSRPSDLGEEQQPRMLRFPEERGKFEGKPDTTLQTAQITGHIREEIFPDSFNCSRCAKDILYGEKDEHNDWHFAKDLEAQERQAAKLSSSHQAPQLPTNANASKVRLRALRNSRDKPEKGQTRLSFR